MTVYKYFIKIALKQRVVIGAYSIIFFIIAVLNGSSTSKVDNFFTETGLDIGIVDRSNSQLSKNLKDYLKETNTLIDMEDDEDYIKERIFLEVADAVIVIPKDFEEKVVSKENTIQLYKDSRKVESLQIQNQINKFLVFANATYDKGEFNFKDLRLALSEKAKVELTNNDNKVGDLTADKWFKIYYNFTGYIIIAIYIAVMGLVMTDFSNEHIGSRIKISSMRFMKFNREVYLGQLTVAILISLLFIVGSIVIKGKYIGDIDFTKYAINMIVYSFSILCFTFLINSITRNRFIINGLSTVVSLGAAFISGVFVPQELLSESVLRISKFFPTYYFVKINETGISSFLDVKYELSMQILFAIAFLVIGLYFSKVKQRSI